ncbi:MAG: LD-carboxypeptidase [Nitrospinae bacterium]|nr:LD-carboxypeptidase [Nitrospinota bacterium]
MKKKKQAETELSICAPSSPFAKKDLLPGVKWIRSLGLKVSFPEEIFQWKGHLAGPDHVRAGVLLKSLKESRIIVAARGGGGCGRLYPLVKKGLAALKPYSRLIVGSSDATFLYLFFQSLSPQAFVYGPMARRYGNSEFKGFEKKVMEAVFRGTIKFPLPYPGQFSIAKEGKETQGRLDGGNLTILASSLGTPYEWKPKGNILYIEDVNEQLYRIDRMLTQLGHAGKFKGFKAVLVGRMDGPSDPAWISLKECFLEHFGKMEGPVLARIPTGHGKIQWPFFLGGEYSAGKEIICLDAYC